MQSFKQFLTEAKAGQKVYTLHVADPGDGDPDEAPSYVHGVHPTKGAAVAHGRALGKAGHIAKFHVESHVLGHVHKKYKYGEAGKQEHEQYYHNGEEE